MTEPVYEVLWPLGKIGYEIKPLAHRISDLRDKTIGELWNHMFRGDEIFSTIREVLQERYPGVKFVDHTFFGNTHGQNELEVVAALPEKLREQGCDAVISAVGA